MFGKGALQYRSELERLRTILHVSTFERVRRKTLTVFSLYLCISFLSHSFGGIVDGGLSEGAAF